MGHRRIGFVAVVAALFVPGACATPHRPFRTSTLPVNTTLAILRDPAARTAVAATSLEAHETFTLAVVEFDEQGFGRETPRGGLAALQLTADPTRVRGG